MSDPTLAGTVSSVGGVVSRLSPFAVDATLGRLKSSVASHQLTLFAQIDHSDEAKRVGLTMPEAHLLIFGSPQAGTPLMIASPLLALELPLKALVWQDQAGQVWVSYDSSAYLAQRFAIPAELVKNIAGIEGVIASALQS
jgi:uncharacterized protein (DUF302 family)